MEEKCNPLGEISLAEIKGRAFRCHLLHVDDRGSVTRSPRCIVITDTDIYDLIPVVNKQSRAHVQEIRPISSLSSLKFSRSSLGYFTLSYKDGKINKYQSNLAVDCAKTLQTKMKNIGISSKSLRAKANDDVMYGEKYLVRTERLLKQFEKTPNLAIIQSVMDLLRESTELFAAVNDDRYQIVLKTINGFLSRSDVQVLLEGSRTSSKFCIENEGDDSEKHVDCPDWLQDSLWKNFPNSRNNSPSRLRPPPSENTEEDSIADEVATCESYSDSYLDVTVGSNLITNELTEYLGNITAEFNEMMKSFNSPFGELVVNHSLDEVDNLTIEDIERIIDGHSFMDEDL